MERNSDLYPEGHGEREDDFGDGDLPARPGADPFAHARAWAFANSGPFTEPASWADAYAFATAARAPADSAADAYADAFTWARVYVERQTIRR